MRTHSPKHWLVKLPPSRAAVVVAHLERLIQHDWRLVTRTADRRLAFQYADEPDVALTFGEPDENISSAILTLNRQLTPAVTKWIRRDPAFRANVLRTAAQSMLDGDVDVTRGLLRRMVDATLGFAALGSLMQVHPKSLIRMLSRLGNPSARNLAGILAHVARWHRIRFEVLALTSSVRRP